MSAVIATHRKPRKMIGAFPHDMELLKRVIGTGRNYNPRINGLTHVTPTHAVLQADGDPTYYLVAITAEQSKALGYVEL